MSVLALTLLRIGFLAVLWIFVLVVAGVLRRDLAAPQDAPIGGGTGAAAAVQSSGRGARSRQRSRANSLVVVQGSMQGTVLPLGTTTITIGRAPDCTLVISDDYASSHHCRIYPAEGRWLVDDGGSTNGTWIDRSRITGPTVLEVGAPLRVGRTVIELRK